MDRPIAPAAEHELVEELERFARTNRERSPDIAILAARAANAIQWLRMELNESRKRKG